MFIGGGWALMPMATFGGMLVNYGWREAQNQEIETALKAGVAASAHFMRGNIADAEEQIKERVAAVMRGLLDDALLDADDIFITHENGRTIITIGGDATFAFRTLWAGGGAGEPEPINERVMLEFEASKFEFALALDVSRSMGVRPVGWTSAKLDTLKQSIRSISETVNDLTETNPNTRFVAYSHPGSRIAGLADSAMSHVMRKTLDPSFAPDGYLSHGENHWNLVGTGAAVYSAQKRP